MSDTKEGKNRGATQAAESKQAVSEQTPELLLHIDGQKVEYGRNPFWPVPLPPPALTIPRVHLLSLSTLGPFQSS